MNSASGLLPPEEASAVDQSIDHEPKTAEQTDWVELIGSPVTRIPDFSYGTIAGPIRP
jgi:hypothetical protein